MRRLVCDRFYTNREYRDKYYDTLEEHIFSIRKMAGVPQPKHWTECIGDFFQGGCKAFVLLKAGEVMISFIPGGQVVALTGLAGKLAYDYIDYKENEEAYLTKQ